MARKFAIVLLVLIAFSGVADCWFGSKDILNFVKNQKANSKSIQDNGGGGK